MMSSFIEKAIKAEYGNIEWFEDNAPLVSAMAQQSQAYALIAIAQELKRLNDRLDQWAEDNPKYPGLRVWPYGS